MCKKKNVAITIDDKIVMIKNLPFNMTKEEVINMALYELNLDSSNKYKYQSLSKFIIEDKNLNFSDKVVIQVDYLEVIDRVVA